MEAGQSGVSGVAVWLPVETVPGKEPGNVTIPNHSLEVGIVVESNTDVELCSTGHCPGTGKSTNLLQLSSNKNKTIFFTFS